MYLREYISNLSIGYIDISLCSLKEIIEKKKIVEKQSKFEGISSKSTLKEIEKVMNYVYRIYDDSYLPDKTLILATLYNLKHSIELFCKEISPSYGHDIDKLFKNIVPLLEKIKKQDILQSIINYEKHIDSSLNINRVVDEIHLTRAKNLGYYTNTNLEQDLEKMSKIIKNILSLTKKDVSNTTLRYYERQENIKDVLIKYDNIDELEQLYIDIKFLRKIFSNILFGNQFIKKYGN